MMAQFAYLACGFGIVVLDVKKEEIKDTYIIGTGGSQLKINDITIDDTYIYAATDNGIYTANKTSSFLSDFTVWSKDNSIPNSNGEFSIIHLFNNKIYTNLSVNGVKTTQFIIMMGLGIRLLKLLGRITTRLKIRRMLLLLRIVRV